MQIYRCCIEVDLISQPALLVACYSWEHPMIASAIASESAVTRTSDLARDSVALIYTQAAAVESQAPCTARAQSLQTYVHVPAGPPGSAL